LTKDTSNSFWELLDYLLAALKLSTEEHDYSSWQGHWRLSCPKGHLWRQNPIARNNKTLH